MLKQYHPVWSEDRVFEAYANDGHVALDGITGAGHYLHLCSSVTH